MNALNILGLKIELESWDWIFRCNRAMLITVESHPVRFSEPPISLWEPLDNKIK